MKLAKTQRAKEVYTSVNTLAARTWEKNQT
jgi:hypothetical protein